MEYLRRSYDCLHSEGRQPGATGAESRHVRHVGVDAILAGSLACCSLRLSDCPAVCFGGCHSLSRPLWASGTGHEPTWHWQQMEALCCLCLQNILRGKGVEVAEFESLSPGAVADFCYARGFLQLLWECGGGLAAPAIADAVIHKLQVYIAPKVVRVHLPFPCTLECFQIATLMMRLSVHAMVNSVNPTPSKQRSQVLTPFHHQLPRMSGASPPPSFSAWFRPVLFRDI